MVGFFYSANRNRNFRFVKVSTETDRNSWKIVGFGFGWFRFLGLEFRPVGPSVFFPKIFCLVFFYFFLNAIFKPLVLWPFYALIKSFLEICFGPLLGISCGPDLGILYFRNRNLWAFFSFLFWPFWPRFGSFLFWPFLGLFTHP